MAFELQPTLASADVTLRPLRESDHDALYVVASDPMIWEQHPDKDRSTPAGFRRFFEDAMRSRGALLAIDARTGEVIGSSRYHGHDEVASEVEIGWTFLARSHWGGRYNGAMKHLMLGHAFRFVRHVVFIVDHENRRSQRAVEKLGALRVGSQIAGDGRPNWVFRLDAGRYAELRAVPD